MAKTQRFSILLGTALALTLSQAAVAVESMRASDLLEACRAYQEDSRSPEARTCEAFIQGYLSASGEIVAADKSTDGFFARALRTRGVRLSEKAERRLTSPYCLPEGETLSGLIAKLAGGSNQFAVDAEAGVVMRHLFKEHYLCEAVQQS